MLHFCFNMKFTYFSYCRYHFTKEFIIIQIKETLPNFISYLSWFTGFTCLCSCNVICWLDACINCRYYEGTSNVALPDIYLFETIRLFLTSHTCFGKNSVVDAFPRVMTWMLMSWYNAWLHTDQDASWISSDASEWFYAG